MQEAAQQAAAAIGSAPDAAEVFDANPRTMEAAVANLARFTSDRPAGAAAADCCTRCCPVIQSVLTWYQSPTS